MRYENFYQWLLLLFALIVIGTLGFFFFKEVDPEYKKYQFAYRKLENFRSSYTHEPPAPFETGVKQILVPNNDQGPEIIDRCTSCHLTMDLPHFSPTQPALDLNENPILDEQGYPVLTPNPDYVFFKLDEKIVELKRENNDAEAEKLSSLKYLVIEGKRIDLSKVLSAHPLIGSEKHPFEFHPLETYGCNTCHSGNGRALVAKRAHGPVYDGEYGKYYETPKPQFLERDEKNDPTFSKMYNDKPDHDLIFQTTPILTGPLTVASCVQCHCEKCFITQDEASSTEKNQRQLDSIQQGIRNDRQALISLLILNEAVKIQGHQQTINQINQELSNYLLSSYEIDSYEGMKSYLVNNWKGDKKSFEEKVFEDARRITGSSTSAEKLFQSVDKDHNLKTVSKTVDAFLLNHEDAETPGSIFAKMRQSKEIGNAIHRVEEARFPLSETEKSTSLMKTMETSVDKLTSNYQKGQELFISQACYACHRIAGFSRSSVGPELTKAGYSYPWYIKESIVWPQADLPSSTMPNFRLDHEELQNLMIFLMSQKGPTKAISGVNYEAAVRSWENGRKMPWEKPIPPTKMEDLNYSMDIFASEGCASCHKLQGFTSDVGFSIEKENPDISQLIKEKEWFSGLFPEQIPGSEIARRIEENSKEIQKRLSPHVRNKSILEKIAENHPGLLESFYSNFKYAGRVRNQEGYQNLLHQVLMMYIQEYGLGRDIAPHLNWSGVYRDDGWLLGHFHNPMAYTAKSIMPVMPFDDSKFLSLNQMLHILGEKNRDELHRFWKAEGFDPAAAFQMLCSSCHGVQRQGNGIIAEWIYPIPKNLRNPLFLRNLTKERAIYSITHGVRGTPMAPWGEVSPETNGLPVLTQFEILQLVDWLYQDLPIAPTVTHADIFPKWEYQPQEIVHEMVQEKRLLPPVANTDEDLGNYYFESKKNPIEGPDAYLYYIRNKFYTPENLKAGGEFFLMNCASCHGKDGTGTGLRSTSMIEAKPRMFTNLPWARMRDDLRLLRSIKYGVSGTSMVPWGDATTSEQRMQLVMYIRNLIRAPMLRDDLGQLLYEIFDLNEIQVNKARLKEYSDLEALKNRREQLFNKREELALSNKAHPEELGKLYVEEIALTKEIKIAEKRDELFKELSKNIKEEKGIYKVLGEALIIRGVEENYVQKFFEYIEKYPFKYEIKGETLSISLVRSSLEEREVLFNEIVKYLDAFIAKYQTQINQLQKSSIKSNLAHLENLTEEQGAYVNLRTKFVVELANAKEVEQKQLALSKFL